MKTLKNTIAIALLIFVVSCSKKDEPSPPAEESKLALPAALSNNTLFLIPDATSTKPTTYCGSDAQPGSVVSEIVIDKDGIIKDASKVTVEIDLEHKYGGEIIIELFAPNGASCGLLKRAFSFSDSHCLVSKDLKFISGNKLSFNSLFTDNFTLLLANNIVPTGNYKPTAADAGTYPAAVLMTPLNTFFTGKNIKGIWKIKAYDCSKYDAGKLNSWQIKFDTGALE